MRASIGRFGPFVVVEKEFRSIPKDESVFEITFERALELLAQPKRSAKVLLKTLGQNADGHDIELFKGRYGPLCY